MSSPRLRLTFAVTAAALAAGSGSRATALARAELELPRENPVARLSQQIGLTEISVEYGSPAVRGRRIWGGIVPYGKPWSPGSYQAAKVRFSRDVTVAGMSVAAGSYALFLIPTKAAWTIALNKNAEQLASGRDYKPELDAGRAQLRPKSGPQRERLAFTFATFDDDEASLELTWDKLTVAIPVRVHTTQEVLANIGALDNTWRAYANAARYMLETKKDYDTGLRYVNQSLALREDWYNLWIKALLLAAKAEYKNAVQVAGHALEEGLKSRDPLFPEPELRKALADWDQKNVATR
jgi:DUF2911 family protein